MESWEHIAARATVYLWALPLSTVEPRVANMVTSDEKGFFRMDAEMSHGRQVRPAARCATTGKEFRAGCSGRRLDRLGPGAALHVAARFFGGLVQGRLRSHPEPTYSVRGRTQAGPGRTVRIILMSGDAFPFGATAAVQPDGRYEFRNVPAGRYQFFAGWTGSGINVSGDVEDVKIDISWPDQTRTPQTVPAMPPDFNEEMARSELEAIDQAEHTYAKTYGKSFARSLTVLGPPPTWYHATADYAGLLSKLGTSFIDDEDATHFTYMGFRFTPRSGLNRTRYRESHAVPLSARPYLSVRQDRDPKLLHGRERCNPCQKQRWSGEQRGSRGNTGSLLAQRNDSVADRQFEMVHVEHFNRSVLKLPAASGRGCRQGRERCPAITFVSATVES